MPTRGIMLGRGIFLLFLCIHGLIHAHELDDYLRSHNFFLSPNGNLYGKDTNEGYMTEAQARQFTEKLREHPNIRTILEIGLNGGHSAYHFIQCIGKFEKLVSFDLGCSPYTMCAIDFFEQKYGSRFEFVKGPSSKSLPIYHASHPDQTFDLIYIDGSHDYEDVKNDIINCKKFAHKNTLIWIDDFTFSGPTQALGELLGWGLIQIGPQFKSDDPCGGRSWIQISYAQ